MFGLNLVFGVTEADVGPRDIIHIIVLKMLFLPAHLSVTNWSHMSYGNYNEMYQHRDILAASCWSA